MPLTHLKVSAKSDPGDTTLVRPSDWNAAHKGNNFGIINVLDNGVMGDDVTDDTAAIQAVIDAAPFGSVIYFPPTGLADGGRYRFSNLTLKPNMTYRGGGTGGPTFLVRIAGSTGTAIREKTPAEGNSGGAGGLWIRDLSLEGNGTAGDGLVIGWGDPGLGLNYNASIENVHVKDFPSGTGININANATRCTFLWASDCSKGITTFGVGSQFTGLWGEGNSDVNVEINTNRSLYYQIHSEGGNVTPIRIIGAQNTVFGVTIQLGTNLTILGGAAVKVDGSINAIYGLTLDNGAGLTWTNTIAGYTTAVMDTGTKDRVPMWVDTAGAQPIYIVNGSTSDAAITLGSGDVIADKLSSGRWWIGGSVAATTPGSVVKKIQIFDQSGASLGYIPVYSAIT